MTPVSGPAPTPRRTRHPSGLLLLLLLVLPLLGGCLRAQMSLGISSDDRVAGELVLAQPAMDGATGPAVTVPDALGERVRVEDYSATDESGAFIGKRVFFSDLSFPDLQLLTGLSAEVADAYRLELRRSGDIVSLDGEVDLSAATAGAQVQLRVNFPSRIATTNGQRDSETAVSWTMATGSVTLVQATARYADPSTRSFTGWTVLVGGIVLAVAAAVAVLARLSRDRSPRPGRVRA